MDSVSADIEFFMESTGAPLSVAHRKLVENRGDPNDAINAYILENKLDELEDVSMEAEEEDSEILDTGGASSSQQIHVPNDSQQEFEVDGDDFNRAIQMSLEGANHPTPVPLTSEVEKTMKSLNIDEEQELSKTTLRELATKTPAITIIVRMPDGVHIDRRFRTTDKLRVVYDFVTTVGFRSEGTGVYRLVTRFPRRVFGLELISSTFKEVGLNKDATLYVEMYR